MSTTTTINTNQVSTIKTQRKVIDQVVSKAQAEGVGAIVHRSIGTARLRNLDPFLMLDEARVSYPAGFPDHPHRGFETVTYMLSGQTAHEDFAGHKGIIGPGDLQWMTAGRGIVHAEMPAIKDPNFESTGLQLWVNLASKDKMCEPNYQDLKDADIPRAKPSDGVVIKVIAGESFGINSPVRTKTPVMYLDFKMEPNTSVEQAIPATFQTAFIYTLSGEIKVGGDGAIAKEHTTVVLDQGKVNETTYVSIKAMDQPAHFVLIAGQPINEPIVQHGPFVMNDKDEIQQAFMDYMTHQNGFEKSKKWRSEVGKKYTEF